MKKKNNEEDLSLHELRMKYYEDMIKILTIAKYLLLLLVTVALVYIIFAIETNY